MSTTLTAKDFQHPLLRALGDLSGGKAGVPVKGEDTYAPVMDLMGITDINALGVETSSGQPLVARQIQWACKNLRKSGHADLEGRGQWVLTDKGTQEYKMMTAPTMTTPDPAPVAPVVTDPAPVATTRPGYLDDPYILSLVLAQTPCLGHYTTHKGAECVSCPVSTECRNFLRGKMAQAARQFAKTDAEEAARQAARQTKPVTTGAAPAVPNAAPPVKVGLGSIDKDSAQKFPAFEDAHCSLCDEVIRRGEDVLWADLQGLPEGEDSIRMFHPKCFEKLP